MTKKCLVVLLSSCMIGLVLPGLTWQLISLVEIMSLLWALTMM